MQTDGVAPRQPTPVLGELLERLGRVLGLTLGRCRLEVNYEAGRVRDVVLQRRVSVPELPELDEAIDAAFRTEGGTHIPPDARVEADGSFGPSR